MNLMLFGPPGSGKGTQSVKLAESFNLTHLSTGDILREAVANKTPLGIKIKSIMEKGELVPDDLVFGILTEKMLNNKTNGFVFDGFPRTIHQAELLDEILTTYQHKIDIVFAIDVKEEELFRRILGRSAVSSRSDDNEKVIHNRLVVYKNQTLPLFDYYQKQNKLISINGMTDIDNVFNKISNFINNHFLKN